jgi:hypothetical protein
VIHQVSDRFRVGTGPHRTYLPGPVPHDILLHRLSYINIDLTYRLDGGRTPSLPGPSPQLTSAVGTSFCWISPPPPQRSTPIAYQWWPHHAPIGFSVTCMGLSSFASTFDHFSSHPARGTLELTGQASKFFFYSAGVSERCLIPCLLCRLLPNGLCHCLSATSLSLPACCAAACMLRCCLSANYSANVMSSSSSLSS